MDASPIDLQFRGQLLLPEQRQIYDYWIGLCEGRRMPARADVHPSGLLAYLPTISLVERTGQAFKYRLAGTRLREAYGLELTGKDIDEMVFDLPTRAYWRSSFERAVRLRKPIQGVSPFRSRKKDDLFDFWMRLPLSSDGEMVDMLLCYEAFLLPAQASALSVRQTLAIAS